MAYTALYRKWRPTSFADVKGQDAIVTTLKNQIRNGRIGHAYLFCGTRGTGKTTVAKIFARAVNCSHPVDGNPCGECESCQEIASGASMNVVEIDAASNNGVDNIREIRDEVQYSPADGKYRVYIIDEVHMLSTGAFNALLKTLEEPPAYVIFILATTEPHKIPVTVLSRCQRYDFKRMSIDTLMERLTELTRGEGVDIDDKALRYIARKADGAMRDAISLLDQCIAFHIGEPLTYDRVLSVLGAVDNEVFSKLNRALLEGRTEECLRQIDELVMNGRELSQFVQDYIWYLRSLLLLSASDANAEILDVTDEDRARLAEEAAMASSESWMRWIRVFSELFNQMRGAVNKRVLLEIAVIRTARPAMEENLESVMERMDKLERKLADGIKAAQIAAMSPQAMAGSAAPDAAVKEPEKPAVVELPKADYDDLMAVRSFWNEVAGEVMADDIYVGKALRETRLEPMSSGILCVVFFNAYNYNICKRAHSLEELVKPLVEGRLGKSVELESRLQAEPGEEPEYRAVTDSELAEVIHAPIEMVDEGEDQE